MGYDSDDDSEIGRDSRYLGFMFGNVDESGDVDANYLDEDAKEHLAAFSDKLDPSLTELHHHIRTLSAEQDCYEPEKKADNAVDYYDFDEDFEEYDDDEVDRLLLPTSEYDLLANRVSLEPTATAGSLSDDDENYDEEEIAGDHIHKLSCSVSVDRHNESMEVSHNVVEENEEEALKEGNHNMSESSFIDKDSNFANLEEDLCFIAEPTGDVSVQTEKQTPFGGQQDWEDDIVWGNSPQASDSSGDRCENSGHDHTGTKNVLHSDGVRKLVHKLGSRNRDMVVGSWLDQIIWEPDVPTEKKPKQPILALQDEQMVFEILGNEDIEHLSLNSRAMMITGPVKSSNGDSFELLDLDVDCGRQYSESKTCQQPNRKI